MSKRLQIFWFAVGVGVFVAGFLLAFRPFGIELDGWRDVRFWLILSLAPFNMLLVLGIDAGWKRLASRWPVLQKPNAELLVTVALVIFGNVAYQAFFQGKFDLAEMVLLIWRVSLIAAFPTLFFILYNRQRNKKAETAQSQALFTLRDESNREVLAVPADDLLFVASDRNYALVHTRSADHPHLLRTSLKNLEAQLADTSIIRCHRSYLVNISQVLRSRRHARGLHLTLRNAQATVPVSESFMESINRHLNAN